MIIFRRENTDPYYNLATEEFVLKNVPDDSFMLWRNKPSIIVGKHQNTLAEVNLEYVRQHQLPVVRRLSGGGAVFHDLGNLNFTFIQTGEDHNLVDFRKFTKPILDVLQHMGIDAQFEGRNDLTIAGKKFSGNAEHIWKNRVLHHGTLLFSSTLADLSQALNADPTKFQDKAVRSVRSRVTNITEHLPYEMNVTEFAQRIEYHILNTNSDVQILEFTQGQQTKIQELVTSKYNTWDWNFGYSPQYALQKTVRSQKGGTLQFNLDVKNGIITDLKIFGDYFSRKDTILLEEFLKGTHHNELAVRSKLSNLKIDEYFINLTIDEFLMGFF
jgi:lipoate-protein ligase A